jgi:D-alanine-D-alanine ligase
MVKSNKHFEIVRSTASGLSSMGQKSCDSIFAVLSKHYTKVGVTVVNNLSDLEALVACKPDLVFLGMECIPVNPLLGVTDPDKIWITKYLDENGIAYTGSNQSAHQLERNKPIAKQRVLDAGLRTSAFCVIKQNQLLGRNDISLAYPLFIKPSDRGGGLGIDSDSVVYNFEQLLSKVHSITTELRADSLIEEYLPGREFSVAVLKDEHPKGFLVMPIELVAPPDEDGARLLSGHVKSSNTEQALEVTDKVVKSKVSALALDVFYALGARDYGRIDIRLDTTGVPHFLEANLIPSLISGYGSFPKACVLNIGLEYESMILRIAKLGLARNVNDIEDVLAPPTVSVSSPRIAFEPL